MFSKNKKALQINDLQGLRVPEAGLEPALVFKYQSDFKSDASTNSATRAGVSYF